MKKIFFPWRGAACLLTLGLLLAEPAQTWASTPVLTAGSFVPLTTFGAVLNQRAQTGYIQGGYESNPNDRCSTDFVLYGLFGGPAGYYLRTDLGEFVWGQTEYYPGTTTARCVRFPMGYGYHGSFVTITSYQTGEVQEGEFSSFPACP